MPEERFRMIIPPENKDGLLSKRELKCCSLGRIICKINDINESYSVSSLTSLQINSFRAALI